MIHASDRGTSVRTKRPFFVMVGSANNSSNLGDECMWEAAASVLREQLPDHQIATDSQAPAEWIPPIGGVDAYPFLYPLLQRGHVRGRNLTNAWPLMHSAVSRPGAIKHAEKRLAQHLAHPSRDNLHQLWERLIAESKGLIFTGAGAITDDYAVHGVFSWRLMTEVAQRHGKPVAFIGQGIGPLNHPSVRVRTREMLASAELLTLREDRSQTVVRDLGIHHGSVQGDWALLLNPSKSDEEAASTALRELVDDQSFIAVSLHRRGDTTDDTITQYARLTGELVDLARKTQQQLIFVPNMTQGRYSDDRETARQIIRKLPTEQSKIPLILDRKLSAGATKSLLSSASLLVTSRYHPLVFAMSAGVPVIGASLDEYYDQKLAGASKNFGVEGNIARLLHLPDMLPGFFDAIESFMPSLDTSVEQNQMRTSLVGFLNRALNRSGQ